MNPLDWLKSLLGRGEDRYDAFSPSDRLIYHFWDGRKTVHADPMLLYKRLAAKGADIEVVSKVAASTLVKDEDRRKAHDDLVRYVRDVFMLPGPDGVDCVGCLTEPQCVELLDHFYTFVGAVKKKPNPTPIPPAETSAPTPSSSGESLPTTKPSDSGSTAAAPKTDSPESSPSECRSPSEVSPRPSTTSSP